MAKKINVKKKIIDNYWQDRLEKAQDALYNKTANDSARELAEQYLRIEKDIQTKIELLYDEITRNAIGRKLSVADLYSYNKYYDMLNDLRQQMNDLGIKEYRIMDRKLQQMYRQNRGIVGKQLGITTRVDRNKVLAITDAYWQGNNNWSDRLWRNKSLLTQRVTDGLIDCVATGASHDELVSRIMKEFGSGFNDANRLVRTELSHVQNRSTLDSYKDAGIERYEYRSATNVNMNVQKSRIARGKQKKPTVVCEFCSELDGKIFRLDEAQEGVNFPPGHPYCRCSIRAVIE